MLEKEEIFSWTLRKKKETVHCFVLILVKIVPGQKQIQFSFQKIKKGLHLFLITVRLTLRMKRD